MIKIRERVFVVDVTVRHEDEDILDKGHRSELDKYGPILQTLKTRVGAESGEVLPIVVGTRGAMPETTIEALRRINVTDRKTLITLSLITLRNSINMYYTFMDSDAQSDTEEQ